MGTTANVLSDAISYQGDYGISRNPESFAEFGGRIYFTDAKRGSVLRLSRDGLTPISEYGMSTFFMDNLTDPDVINGNVIGGFDPDNGEYIISFRATTIAFHEPSKRDCVLLIAAALGVGELADLHGRAVEIGLDVLVEIHDEDELGHALAAGAALVGVNQRDLVTFEVDHERALRMATVMPAGVLAVAESGVRGHDDAAALAGAGYSAVLVGESLVTSGDPAAAVREMRRR